MLGALTRKVLAKTASGPTNANQLRLLFYLLWIILSYFQAAYTELLDDEAYYWKISTRLEWGYFEHPPMIALLIRCGFFIFKNELGVRLLPNLLAAGSVLLAEKLIQPKNTKLFFVIVSSVAILQLAGIFAIPETPLIFFSLLFFVAYRKYLQSDSLFNTILLAISISLLLYSKYTGILVVVFSLLSDVSILKRKTIWLAFLISLFLFSPHIMWQVNNNFPTIRYHLFERSSKSYHFSHTLNYILSQPFVFGPFMGLIFIYSIFAFKPANLIDRIIRNNAVGILAFFLLMTFKGRVEANWTWAAAFPLIYVAYRSAEKDLQLRKLVYRLFPFTIFSIFICRLYMVWDFLPESLRANPEFHESRCWTDQLSQLAGNAAVGFLNSSQKAAKFEFYIGRKSFSLNTGLSKKNQYYLWDSEYEFQGKKVLMILDFYQKNYPIIQTAKASFAYTFISNFRSFGNIKITPDRTLVKVTRNEAIYLRVKLNYRNENLRDFQSDPNHPPSLGYIIYKGDKKIAEKTTGPKISADTFQNKDCILTINAPSVAGEYKIYVVITTGLLPPSIDGGQIKLVVNN